jgi:hypothetical protein
MVVPGTDSDLRSQPFDASSPSSPPPPPSTFGDSPSVNNPNQTFVPCGNIVKVKISSLRYSQDTISERFSHHRGSIYGLLEQINRAFRDRGATANPDEVLHEILKEEGRMEMIWQNNHWHVLSNRRLWCVKRAFHPEAEISVRDVSKDRARLEEFLQWKWSTGTDGLNVAVKPKGYKRKIAESQEDVVERHVFVRASAGEVF